jgi:hypothetical protein
MCRTGRTPWACAGEARPDPSGFDASAAPQARDQPERNGLTSASRRLIPENSTANDDFKAPAPKSLHHYLSSLRQVRKGESGRNPAS